MLLIYEDETAWESLSQAERKESVSRHIAFANYLRAEGRFVYGDALQPTSTATSVRLDGTKPVIVDGPSAETKEQLAGFYIGEPRSGPCRRRQTRRP